jgi:hypothetical protein
MTCYELLIDKFIHKVGNKVFMENEKSYVVKASIMSGILAAFVVNFMEVIVISKQSESKHTIMDMIRIDGHKMVTKGLAAKLLLTTCSSVVFFMSMN